MVFCQKNLVFVFWLWSRDEYEAGYCCTVIDTTLGNKSFLEYPNGIRDIILRFNYLTFFVVCVLTSEIVTNVS